MDLTEFFLIYLSCGSPLGVYFFIQNRKRLSRFQLWLKFLFTVFVWIPYAYQLLNDFATSKKEIAESKRILLLNEELKTIQKNLTTIELKSSIKISLFEVREVLERYAGLSLANRSNNETFRNPEYEIFRISLRQNSQVAARCLHRRNLQHLNFHQSLARKDFLRLVGKLSLSVRDKTRLEILARDFVGLLKDQTAQIEIEKLFNSPAQIVEKIPVNHPGRDVWDSEEHRMMPVKRISA